MAAAARALTRRDGWQHDVIEIRSLSLAARHPMLQGAAKLYWERDPRGHVIYKVLSKRTWRYEHEVAYDAATDRVISCSCEASKHSTGNRPCYHRGVVREVIQRTKMGMYGCEW